jgi:outer membrane protein OmpA-like peptidoglycan-associated protein
VGVSESGEEVPEPVVSIQNVRVTDVSPTLGYVFFEDGSRDIPDRYNRFSESREVKGYQMNSFFKLDALGLHYEVLNIIGKRLQEEGQSKIVLTGTRSIHSSGDSLSDENIALARAQSVSKYLQDVWGISPARIRIKSRGLPEQASEDNTISGQAENRRVEISSLDPKLLDPIETKRIERTASPPRIAFDPYITSSAGVRSVNITIKQGEKVLEKIDGLTGERTKEWLWNIPSENIVAGTGDTVTWEMSILDSAGNTAEVSGKIGIRREEKTLDMMRRDTVIDKSLERFQLLLFDYSKTSSSHDYNLNSLLSRVAATITPDSRISLIGYTDVTGDPAYNDRLSLDRASKASILLSGKLRQNGLRTPQFTIEGRGSREVLYDNTYPEGRFLSRTVRISIEKDLK